MLKKQQILFIFILNYQYKHFGPLCESKYKKVISFFSYTTLPSWQIFEIA